MPGTDRSVYGEGEGSGAYSDSEDAQTAAAKLSDAAEQTAEQTVAAEQADKTGVSDNAEAADSSYRYFSVLLQERMGSLFECQRLSVYWETEQDHVTIFKTSPEHELILSAGAYDVSARLLEENLRVDDGWVARKNPGVIVKIVDGGVLGGSVASEYAAQGVYANLAARDGWQAIDAVKNGRVLLLSQQMLDAPYMRLAAMLLIAKTSNPSLFEDVDAASMLTMLAEEATGSIPVGVYYYVGGQ